MIPVTVEQQSKLTEGLVQLAIAAHVRWWQVTAIPNLSLWHEMDMAVLTRAGCLWEYEIKLSQADWERDQEKDVVPPTPEWLKDVASDWQGWRPRARRNLTYVERFYYVHAPDLVCPTWVPEWCGLIVVQFRTIGGRVRQ